jgi:hypothetical protein
MTGNISGQPLLANSVEIIMLIRPMDLWVRREPDITPKDSAMHQK